jgi:hypothetical protein
LYVRIIRLQSNEIHNLTKIGYFQNSFLWNLFSLRCSPYHYLKNNYKGGGGAFFSKSWPWWILWKLLFVVHPCIILVPTCITHPLFWFAQFDHTLNSLPMSLCESHLKVLSPSYFFWRLAVRECALGLHFWFKFKNQKIILLWYHFTILRAHQWCT